MTYFLGIDGGGTKTKVIIINEHEEIMFENTSGPSSIDTVDIEQTSTSLYEAISPFFLENKDMYIDAVFAGIGGIVFEKDFEQVESLIRQLPFINKNARVRARNDMENALYSGDCFNEGITIICGTGVVAFGKDATKSHKSSGWGYKEGDLGSGYHLGVEAIRYTIRAFDGRYPKDEFAKEVAKAIHMKEATDIIQISDRYYNDRTLTASLAPIVTTYANLDHPYAKRIIDVATDEVALAFKAVYDRLSLNHKTCVIVGSLGNAPGYYKTSLHRKIKSIDADINIISPIFDPAYAAAKKAKMIYLGQG